MKTAAELRHANNARVAAYVKRHNLIPFTQPLFAGNRPIVVRHMGRDILHFKIHITHVNDTCYDYRLVRRNGELATGPSFTISKDDHFFTI